MPLFTVKFPANAAKFNSYLIDISKFDFIQSEVLLARFAYFPYTGPFNLNFQILKYWSVYSVVNLKTLFFIILLLIAIILLLATIWLFRNTCIQLNKVRGIASRHLFWNGIIRFLMGSYLEVGITVIPHIIKLGVKFSSGFAAVTFTSVFNIIALLIVYFFPVFLIVFYLKRIKDWESDFF